MLDIIWVRRTMADVRRGDLMRIPGDAGPGTLVTQRWLPPRADTEAASTWHVVPGDRGHWGGHVVQYGEVWLVLGGDSAPRHFRPDFAVEILLTAAEFPAIELLGWENRL